ncbi:hypothetical protein BFO_1852 [Tannerella forsythia 92A2]|uniref:Uncharacterized protein n=1 Tax=Tannerella forsythia (strain ATCC 43037 / JCM 10827 / CCUG 21028 A / KCTC 5666 / FDC 338) TaxID=203275 RepID=G8UP52_TANFA|nr:hypothetical protein BFO_1852 [Tannerella forsythia 92A2]
MYILYFFDVYCLSIIGTAKSKKRNRKGSYDGTRGGQQFNSHTAQVVC